MRALAKALRARFVGDATLMSMVNGVYYRLAPQGTLPPYLLFQKVVGWDTYTFGGRALLDYDYIIKAVVSDPVGSAGPQEHAEAVMERVDTILTDQALTVTGYGTEQVRRIRTFEYDVMYADMQIKFDYVQSGEVFAHSGAAYRITLKPSS